MAKVIKVPVLGQSVEGVRLLRWYKQVGDTIAVGEPLAEIETDKVNIDFESTEAGVVRKLLVDVDAFVKVEAPVAIVGTADEVIEPSLSHPPAPSLIGMREGESEIRALDSATPRESTLNSPSLIPIVHALHGHPREGAGGWGAVLASPRAQRVAAECRVDLALLAGRGSGPKGRVQEKDVFAYVEELKSAPEAKSPKASPLARAVATDSGVDLTGVSGTGAGGRSLADDVRPAAPAAPTAPVPTTPAASGGGTRTIAITGMRKRVADNISRSVRTAPHVTLNLSVDMSEAMRLRKEMLPHVEKATGVRLSPTDIVVKAVAVALKDHPGVNAHIDGDTLTLFDDVHVGLAVSLGDDGLIVPVIRDAGRKGLAQIARDRQDLATRARAGKLGGADISGGTFTVSNLGNYGIESFNPIINPPQVAILGVGGIADSIVAVNGAPAVRPMMGLSLSFDHRAMDGAPAAAFLARLKEILETPYLLLL